MKTLQQLYKGFFLDNENANSQISKCNTPLRVAPLEIMKKYEKLEIEKNNFAFCERNEKGKIEYFHGLKNFLCIEKSGFPPIFIFDNHNHAPIFRYNIIYKRYLKHNIQLIHIDQHSDCWENKNHLNLNGNEDELGKVFDFFNQKCNVGNFIPPAIESKIISNQIQIRSITSLKDLNIEKYKNFILDIDLDFCLNGIERNKIDTDCVKILKQKFDEFYPVSLCTTIATSPYFLDQNLAISIINNLLE